MDAVKILTYYVNLHVKRKGYKTQRYVNKCIWLDVIIVYIGCNMRVLLVYMYIELYFKEHIVTVYQFHMHIFVHNPMF